MPQLEIKHLAPQRKKLCDTLTLTLRDDVCDVDIVGADYDNQGWMMLTQAELRTLRDWFVEHVK